MLLPLIIATLIDQADDRARRGRLSELRGRLGLQEKVRRGGLYNRLVWIFGKEVKPGLDQVIAWTWLFDDRDQAWLGTSLGFWPPDQTPLPLRTVANFGSKLLNNGLELAGLWMGRDRNGGKSNSFFEKMQAYAQKRRHAELEATRVISRTMGMGFHTFRIPLDEEWLGPKDRPSNRSTPHLSWIVRELLRAWHKSLEGDQTLLFFLGWLPDLQEIVDWASEEHIDLTPYSVQEAAVASALWHEQFKHTAEFRNPLPDGVVVARFSNGSTIHRLVTKQQLENEGKSMGHCVGGYWPDIKTNRSHIYSLRGPNRVPQATWELTYPTPAITGRVTWDLNQLVGPENIPISIASDEYPLVTWFLHQLGIEMSSMRVLSDELKALTVYRAPGDAPVFLGTRGSVRKDHYPLLTLNDIDVLQAWWGSEDATYQLGERLRDQAHAHSEELTEEDHKRWKEEENAGGGFPDLSFEDWLLDLQETASSEVTAAWDEFHDAMDKEISEVAWWLDRAHYWKSHAGGDPTWRKTWTLEGEADEAPNLFLIADIDTYDGTPRFSVTDHWGSVLGESTRNLTAAVIEAGLMKFEADLEATLAATQGEILIPDAIQGVDHMKALRAAKDSGAQLDRDMLRALRREEAEIKALFKEG